MTRYNSYAEAKIANPDCEIVTTGKDWSYNGKIAGLFEALDTSDEGHRIHNTAWVICNPADYCSTLKEFLGAGFKLVEGDKYLEVVDCVYIVKAEDFYLVNEESSEDCNRYILSAAALNGGCKIPDKAEQWTIYNNTIPLGELSDELDVKLFRAWRNGGEVQFFTSHNEWAKSKYPFSEPKRIYRIKPKSERELFIETSVQLMTSETERTMEQMFGAQFDAGARYTENTQHFGDSV